jgi:ABC-type nickel/cobalt efflux system permease component RcnA
VNSLPQLIQQGSTNLWLFMPSAILLGAFHGLEPGHSKTMMAAFIVAIRGTVRQALLLGVAATISHTAIVWLVALGGTYIGRQWSAETTEPYFQVASAALIIVVALWMIWRTWRQSRAQHEHDLTPATRTMRVTITMKPNASIRDTVSFGWRYSKMGYRRVSGYTRKAATRCDGRQARWF